MGLQAKYDPQTDRMRLTLHPAASAPRAFWVTRRQWLGLLQAVTVLPQSGSAEAPPLPRTKKALTAEALIPAPIPVEAIRLRQLAEGVKLVFVAGAKGMAISLQDPGLQQLKQMLLQQAERAGWDVAAALARLNAQGLARAAMRKASRTL